MKNTKKLVASLVGLLLALGVGVAGAAPDIIFSVSNSNNATISNSTESYAYTGYNTTTADQDVNGGTIDTGKATAESTIENDVNQSVTGATVTDGSDVDIGVGNDNYAYVDNDNYAEADTGENDPTSNNQDVEGGTISTGDAKAETVTDNAVNQNGASVEVTADSDVSVDLTNDNDIELGDENDAYAYTGYNDMTADQDVEDGLIETGDADASSTIDNGGSLNVNLADITVSGGDDISVGVLNTNWVGLTDDSDAEAYSGYNDITATQDVDGGVISTGDADSEATIENDGNQNQTTGSITGANDDVIVGVTNDNDMDKDDYTYAYSDSGENDITATEDVTGGDVSTGAAKAIENILDRFNINITTFDF